jgi:hypothetical protein
MMDPEAIIQGLQVTPADKLRHSPAWVFFPRAPQKETENGELSEE